MILAIYILCLVALVYFLLLRPQQKRKKHLASLVSSMEKGTEVITVGGLHGTVVERGETTVVLQVKDGSCLEFENAAVAKICGETLK